MENKYRKSDLKSKVVRDAGDVRKTDKTVNGGSSYVAKPNDTCDRGDTAAKIGVEKIKIGDRKLAEVLPKNIERAQTYAPPTQPKESDRKPRDEYQTKDPLTKMAELKKIRENYTFRNKFSCGKKLNGECIKKSSDEKVVAENGKDRTAKPSEGEPSRASSPRNPTRNLISPKESNRDNNGKMDTKRSPSPKASLAQQLIRRPIIKTITSKSDKTKVYKAVNFVEKSVQPTSLQINIPTDLKKFKESKPKPALSKISLKERRKRDKKKRIIRSPTVSPDVAVKIRSPPTEVAKWASADNHKKLYYEAWVDTTLAAISKKAKGKKFEKHKLANTFQKALAERPMSPEIDYKMLLDEKYTGKIKVNKR